jgi:hypothetical protein
LEPRAVVAHFLGVAEKNENEEEVLDIQNREPPGRAKSEGHMEVEVPAIEGI